MNKSIPIDLDVPIPFRIRVDSPSTEMRAFVVPGAQRFSTVPPRPEGRGFRAGER